MAKGVLVVYRKRLTRQSPTNFCWCQLSTLESISVSATRLAGLGGELMSSPHIPSIVEHVNIYETDLFELQSQFRTQRTIFPVAIGHDEGVLGEIHHHLVCQLVKIREGQIERTLDVAFVVMIRGPGVNENGST